MLIWDKILLQIDQSLLLCWKWFITACIVPTISATECQLQHVYWGGIMIMIKRVVQENYPLSCDLYRNFMRLKAGWNYYANQVKKNVFRWTWVVTFIRCNTRSNFLYSHVPTCNQCPEGLYRLEYTCSIPYQHISLKLQHLWHDP